MWREWIEIQDAVGTGGRAVSPSVWREWIEMTAATGQAGMCPSPSVWREWIEIETRGESMNARKVSLRVEGVD